MRSSASRGSLRAMSARPLPVAHATPSSRAIPFRIASFALAAAALFVVGRHASWARTTLYVLAGVCLLCVLLVVRNGFGVAFVLVLGLVLGLIAQRTQPGTSQLAVVFLAIQLCTSVFSRSDYLFTATASTGAGALPSDTQQIADALIGPHWFWGGVVAVLSVAILAWGLWTFLSSLKPR